MIIDYSVRNYCSIDDEVTLSFVPTSGFTKLSDLYFVEPKEGLKLLKFGIILGANASGKTTMLRSLEILRMLVCDPFASKNRPLSFYVPYWFKLDKDTPTELSVRFVASNQQYHYEISFNSRCVVRERLRVMGKNWRTIYSRETIEESQTVKIKIGFKYLNYREDFKQLEKNTLWNNTVLGGSLRVSFDIPDIQHAVEWFHEYLFPIIEPDTILMGFVSRLIEEGKINKNRLLSYLRGADLMIDDFIFKKEPWENLDEKIKMRLMESNPEMSLEEIKEKFPIRHVEFVHSNGSSHVNVDYVDESLGTQRFYQLCGILDMLLNQKCIFFIDEIDSSIHPDLLEYFLKTFLVNAKESQLLITTHHREWLMQDGFVRPDSVWFTEKHSDGSTHLYSLADFSDINSFNRSFTYYDAYRRGVLGAMPSYRYYYLDTKDNEI